MSKSASRADYRAAFVPLLNVWWSRQETVVPGRYHSTGRRTATAASKRTLHGNGGSGRVSRVAKARPASQQRRRVTATQAYSRSGSSPSSERWNRAKSASETRASTRPQQWQQQKPSSSSLRCCCKKFPAAWNHSTAVAATANVQQQQTADVYWRHYFRYTHICMYINGCHRRHNRCW